jgi:aminodeoxyfutalosine deaminase
MKKITADYVFVDGKLKPDVLIITDNEGTIVEIDKASNHGADTYLKCAGAIIPGFINAHCHLELSYMKGHVHPGRGLVEFIIELLTKRFSVDEFKEQSFYEADEEMRKNGIVAVGDISNSADTLTRKKESSIVYQTFVECYGFREENAENHFNESLNVYNQFKAADLKASIVPHAPYSMSRKLLSLVEQWQKENQAILSIHNEESEDELKFCMNGEGDFNRMVEFFKLPPNVFTPYGTRSLNGIWKYINDSAQRLLVHNTFMNGEDFETIKDKKDTTWLCTCPNANIYIENTLPDYNLWMKHTNNICIGTDSLASNYQLSIWEEIMKIHQYFPKIEITDLLNWATINGAKALQLNDKLGSIEKGKKPGIILLEYFPFDKTPEIWNTKPRVLE